MSCLDARSAWCVRRAAFVNGANRVREEPVAWGRAWAAWGGHGADRSSDATALPPRAVGSVHAASRDLHVSRRVAAAHLQQLTARVVELGGQAVPGRPVGHRPGHGALAASHSPASSSPPVAATRGKWGGAVTATVQ
jgi:hypothetical protein